MGVLAGCGGSSGTIGGGGTPTLSLDDSSRFQGATAKVEVDLGTNITKITPLTSDSRAVFGPGSVSVSSAEVFSQTGNLTSSRILRLTFKNNTQVRLGGASELGFQIGTAVQSLSTSPFAGIGAGASTDGSVASAAVGSPIGAWEDENGNVFITQGVQGAIRVVNNGSVTTLSSNFSSPGGITGEPTGDFIFFVESGNHRIIRLRKDGREGVTLAGGGAGDAVGPAASARFNNPIGLASDPSTGTLYVADFGNGKIKTVSNWRSGPVQVGTLASGISQPIGVGFGTIDGRPIVATASANTGEVFVIDPTTGTRALIRTVTPNVTGVSVRENRVIVAASNNTVTSIRAGKGASPFTAASWSIEGSLGGPAGYAEGINARFSSPYLLSSGRDGILLADTSNHRVRRIVLPNFIGGFSSQPVTFSNAVHINTNGKATYSIGELDPAQSASVDVGFTVQFGAAMTFYITVYGDVNSTVPVDAQSGSARNVYVREIAGRRDVNRVIDGVGASAGFSNVRSMSATDDDWVFLTEAINGYVRVMSPTGAVTTLIGNRPQGGTQTNGTGDNFVAGSNEFTGISVNRNGTAFVFGTDSALFLATRSGPIDRPSSWTVNLIAGSPTTQGNAPGTGDEARMAFPYPTLSETTNLIYFADALNHRVGTVRFRGGSASNPVNWIVSTLAGSQIGVSGLVDGLLTAARFNLPIDVEPLRSGDLIVADVVNKRIRRVSPTGTVTTLASTAADPSALAIDDSDAIYVSSPDGLSRIYNGAEVRIMAANSPLNDGLAEQVGSGSVSVMPITVNRRTGRVFFYTFLRGTISAVDQIVP